MALRAGGLRRVIDGLRALGTGTTNQTPDPWNLPRSGKPALVPVPVRSTTPRAYQRPTYR